MLAADEEADHALDEQIRNELRDAQEMLEQAIKKREEAQAEVERLCPGIHDARRKRYTGEGDWAGAEEDENDDYDPSAVDLEGVKIKRYTGEGDWAGAEEDVDDDYDGGDDMAGLDGVRIARKGGKKPVRPDEDDEVTLLVPLSVVRAAAAADSDDSGPGDGETITVSAQAGGAAGGGLRAKDSDDDASPGDGGGELVAVSVPKSALRAAALALPDVDDAALTPRGDGSEATVDVKVRRGVPLRALGEAHEDDDGPGLKRVMMTQGDMLAGGGIALGGWADDEVRCRRSRYGRGPSGRGGGALPAGGRADACRALADVGARGGAPDVAAV